MDADEQELWNLDENADDPAPGAEHRPDTPPSSPPSSPAPIAAPDPPEEPDDSDDIDDSGMNEDEDTPPTSAPVADPAPRSHRSGGGEKIALGILAVVLVAGAIWGVSIFIASLPETTPEHQIEFPVVGTSVTIDSADTYWREPDRAKDTGVRINTRLLPAAVITIAESSGSATLRFLFRDENNSIVGDTTTQVVRDGKFADTGGTTIEVYSTSGFLNPGDHAAYTTGQIDSWSLEIREGPAPEAGRTIMGSEFQIIADVPISFNRK